MTWDADIIVPSNYFQQLEMYPSNALTILPVEMKQVNNKTAFFTNEFDFLNQVNYAVFGLKRPIMANGANLIFHKSIFNQLQPYQNNLTIASGDDQFLLKQFIDNKQSISFLRNNALKVITKTPTTIQQCFNQRIRWASKTQKVNDRLANGIGLLGLFYHLTPVFLVILSFNSFFIGIVIKAILDFLIIESKFNLKNVLKSILFSSMYPFYMFSLGFASLFTQVEWKDRVV